MQIEQRKQYSHYDAALVDQRHLPYIADLDRTEIENPRQPRSAETERIKMSFQDKFLKSLAEWNRNALAATTKTTDTVRTANPVSLLTFLSPISAMTEVSPAKSIEMNVSTIQFFIIKCLSAWVAEYLSVQHIDKFIALNYAWKKINTYNLKWNSSNVSL